MAYITEIVVSKITARYGQIAIVRDMDPESIPLPCRTCPAIVPVLEGIKNLETEQFALSEFPELSDCYADATAIERRLCEIDEELESHQLELAELRVRTIGCNGVVLALADFDEENRVGNTTCGSLFATDLPPSKT